MSDKGGEDSYHGITFPARVWGTVLTLDPGRAGVRLSPVGRGVVAGACVVTLILLVLVPALPHLLSLR